MTISIITGGSRGLGRNTALSIARAGGNVVITYQSRADAAQEVVAEIEAMGRKAVALQLDVGNVSSFPAFVQSLRSALASTFGRETFDHLINNAGHGDMALITEATEASFDTLINVHFKGVFFLTQALLPLMVDGGRIVNFSSGLTRITYPGFSARLGTGPRRAGHGSARGRRRGVLRPHSLVPRPNRDRLRHHLRQLARHPAAAARLLVRPGPGRFARRLRQPGEPGRRARRPPVLLPDRRPSEPIDGPSHA